MPIAAALLKMPKLQAIGASASVMFGIGGFCMAILASGRTHVITEDPEWKAAEREYRKYQTMDPVFKK
eukprot:CAMPEP_0117752428 /NCGR_PEP_ID=MMETSP0947-20121206/11602_1 /TAXON_ID=44440 /ORGANISM="Chattonella subsalsa, Strain CCMP2191" /LENGTH=67 /DNA_ID=CAMNT_0005571073 /DNA_START=199 /DNA_END=402 /DNA_ORIENTATION=+